MTNADIFITILAEVTGRPRSTFEPVLDVARLASPDHKLDVELEPDEAERLLMALRAEKSGILNWILARSMQRYRVLQVKQARRQVNP
jgi:hypothetical protein